MRDFERPEDNRLAAALQRLDPDSLAPAPPPSSQWRAAAICVVVAMVALSVGTWAFAQSRHDGRAPAVEPVLSNTPSPVSPSVVPSPASLTPTPSAQPTPTPSTSAQVTSPPAVASVPPTSSPVPSATPIVGGSAWNSHVLVITGHSLGGVSIGMSSPQAARAAHVSAFTPVGDGVQVPAEKANSPQQLYLYLDSFAGQPPASFRGDFLCVAADGSQTATQSVVTAAGLHLGDSAARVREIYGAAATFIPEPTGGIEPHPGYVVHQGQFDLVFKLDSSLSRVIAIAGGFAPMTPSQCNG